MASASPRLGAVGVDPRTVSRDPDVVAAYTADPLIWHHRVPFQVLASGLTMMDDVIARAGQIALPTLWLYGTADALVYPLGSPPTFASLGSTDKTLIAEEGGYHELLNEPDKEKIEATILDWMNRH
jgi:alpha-beta hydrolase superfamily lysophospholipase